jgi:hypothetical protein
MLAPKCSNTLDKEFKLTGNPLEHLQPSYHSNIDSGEVNNLGMVK